MEGGQGVSSLRNVRSYAHEVLPTCLPEHELNGMPLVDVAQWTRTWGGGMGTGIQDSNHTRRSTYNQGMLNMGEVIL